jgi:CubicO group peptidase (beta-lactamase class C family)
MAQISIQSRKTEKMAHKFKLNCLQFGSLVSILLIWLTGYSQTDFSEADLLLKQNQKLLGNNLVALVWKDGKIVYQKQLEKEVGDFNAKTQIPIQSCSQWLTAALVMTFVDQGKLSLDDKVSKYIPIFATYMKTYITLRNCLTNTTGIQADAAGAMKLLQKSKFPSLEDEVNSFASKREIQTNPGTEFYYSHTGPNIAGRVLEIVGKKSFDRLMQERILRPLKMRGTSFANDEGGAVNPSGGAVSTANDYMNFLIMLLNKGEFQGKKVLSEKSVEEMETVQFPQLQVRYTPKGSEGLHHLLGAWIEDTDPRGNIAAVISSLNLAGNWPYIDKCRNYAAVVFIKTPESDARKEIYLNFKEAVDKQFNSTCH